MAERVDLQHDQGATFYRRFVWMNDAATPTAVNVSTYTARMHVRETVDADTTVLELTTENDGITLGGADGYVDLFISADDTAALDPGSYRYDIELVAADGFVTRLAEGKLRIRPEVTR